MELERDLYKAEGAKLKDQLYETPQTVSWDRVNMRLPGIMYELVDVIEQEKKRYQ